MKKFLEYELDRYLAGRGGELIEELPLIRVENQPYIHYRKGSLILYALKDYIGEAAVNEALAEFIDEYAFKGKPYPTTRDLLARFRARTPAPYQLMVTQLFEEIVVYDLEATEGIVHEVADGSYDVDITVLAKQFKADGEGTEQQVPVNLWADVAILGEKQGSFKLPQVLALERVEISAEENTFTLKTTQKPVAVGIDPLNKLIDRNPGNNILQLD